MTSLDTSTEEKIKQAARIVFHSKGFHGTKTRDIAQEAGINLALLNYYFRSKEKLFNLVMLESFQSFFTSITSLFNDPHTSLEEKLELLANNYIDLLIIEPDIPLFLLSEMRNNKESLFEKVHFKEALLHSVLLQQYQQMVKNNQIKPLHFIHFMMNFMGLVVFPFVAKPMLQHIGDLSNEAFNQLVAERKKLIPIWIKTILYA